MITEDYVSYEIAKLLKEKGFDISCKQAYFNGSLVDYTLYGFCDGELLDCPSQSLALKWLREAHGLFVNLDFSVVNNEKGVIWSIIRCNNSCVEFLSEYTFEDTYEQAVEAALKYTLENLI